MARYRRLSARTMTASVNLVRDVITGASPVYNAKEPITGKIHQIISVRIAKQLLR